MIACTTYFVPDFGNGNYYHFMTETALGLFTVLKEEKLLGSRRCWLCYNGRYTSIMRRFTCNPLLARVLAPEQVNFKILQRKALETRNDFLRLLELRAFLVDSNARREALGITVVKRTGLRQYAEHDALVEKLLQTNLPIRVVEFEKLPFERQVEVCRSTKVLVGPHGAGLTNMMFLPCNSAVVELNPRGFSFHYFGLLAAAFGLRLVSLESDRPGMLAGAASRRARRFVEENGWPDRASLLKQPSVDIELIRALRDVQSFSIDPTEVAKAVKGVIEEISQNNW